MKSKILASRSTYYSWLVFSLFCSVFCLGIFYLFLKGYHEDPERLANINSYQVVFFITILVPTIRFIQMLDYATCVEDLGNELKIWKKNIKETIKLIDIKYLSQTHSGNIELEFVRKNIFGSKIIFIPENKNIFKDDVFQDLKDRIYKAHTGIGVTP